MDVKQKHVLRNVVEPTRETKRRSMNISASVGDKSAKLLSMVPTMQELKNPKGMFDVTSFSTVTIT